MMQSKIALVGLVLSRFAAASPCKPSSPTTVNSVSLITSVPTADTSQHSTDIANSKTTINGFLETLSTATTTSTEGYTEAPSSGTTINSDSVTTSSPTSDVPSLTIPQSTTTTEEKPIIVTNAILGGSFARRDLDSPSGLSNFGATGNAEFHLGGCYKGDGSVDDGCAALTADGNPNGKRGFLTRLAGIYQTIKSVPHRKYTIQFLYLVNSAGTQDCVVSATFGNNEFYSLPTTSPGGTRVNWARVLQQVEALNDSPTFAVSLTCSGSGTSSILVDSIFISDKVTPGTIGNYQLDFGWYPPEETTTAFNEVPKSTSHMEELSQTARTSGLQSTNSGKAVSMTSSIESITPTLEDATTIPLVGSDATTSDTAQEIGTTSPPKTTSPAQHISKADTTATAGEPAATSGCSVTCDLIDGVLRHTDDVSCNLMGVFVKTDAIYGFPGDGNSETQYFSRSIQECADLCKRDMPGCKSVGFQKLSGKCYFSNTLVTRDDIGDGRDSQMADWYGIKDCFTCRVRGCESGSVDETSAIEIPFTTTKPVRPTESICKPTCQRIEDFTAHEEDWSCGLYGQASGNTYTLPGDEIPSGENHLFLNIAECGEVCKTLPGCMSAGYQFASRRCFFSNSVVTQDHVTEASDSESADWNSLRCFTCSGCGFDEQSTSEIAATSTRTSRPTSFITTAKASQPTGVCHNTHGEVCEINPSAVEDNPYVCIEGGLFLGQSWTEPRSKYPMQESQEQCAAICETLQD